MIARRRSFLAGSCAFCASALLACTPGDMRPTTGIDSQADLTPRYTPGLRTSSSDSDDDGIRGSLDQMERRLRTSRFLVRDSGVNAYIRSIVHDLAGEYANDIRPYVVRVPDFNATQAPNGMMQVWTGLLTRCTNEAQLAAVLGHEIGHYIRAHSREGIQQRRQIVDAMQIFALIFGAVGVPQVTDLSNLILTAAMFSYSRDHEREADEIGIRLLAERGLAPIEASRNWDNVIAELTALDVPLSRGVLFATHPSGMERAATLRFRSEELPKGETRADRYRRGISGIRAALFEDQLRKGQPAATILIAER